MRKKTAAKGRSRPTRRVKKTSAGPSRAWWGTARAGEPELSIHLRKPIPDRALLEAAARVPAAQTWNHRNPPWSDSLAFRKEIDDLVDRIRPILERAPARRVAQLSASAGYVPPRCRRCGDLLPRIPVQGFRIAQLSLQEELGRHAECVAGLLLEARWLHESDPGRAAAAYLLANVKNAQDELHLAQKSRDRLKSGAAPEALARANLALFGARLKLERARQEQHTWLSSLPDPPKKQQVKAKQGRAIGILHEMHDDYGIPDVTITKLLEAAHLPAMTARTIKRIRLAFRRP